ncbi:uncharacterized protein LOC108087767 [Drosophila ficusphila]|uniref:uncharacterized protein LOC108087767 n=1 Tax=Drosophila ficusphila TaxID=30025 RepID=UPI0007E6BA8A|nr:uncharacterized protein LOC108087767 [Drosophila ficusphila]
MQRSLLLVLISSILLSAALAQPVSSEKAEKKNWLERMMAPGFDPELLDSDELRELNLSIEKTFSKRSPKDASSSSEEHKGTIKDKADSSGDSSSEEKTTTTTAPVESRRRRQIRKLELEVRRRREVSAQEQDPKITDEPELDAQGEKELDEAMVRALSDTDNTSIEDYAQGCEVMEVSSKEANEATYAE